MNKCVEIKNMVINEDLYIQYKSTIELPYNLTVKGSLYLTHTSKTLPDGLDVEGDLVLKNSKIPKLPDDIKIGGNLFLINIEIETLPDNLIINNLSISNTIIERLPDSLVVKGNLYLGCSVIKDFPYFEIKGETYDKETFPCHESIN